MAGGQGGQGGGQGQMPQISPQSISDFQNLLQYYQQNRNNLGGMGGGAGNMQQPPAGTPNVGSFTPAPQPQAPAAPPSPPQGQQVFNTLPYQIPAGTPPPQAPQQQTFNTKPFNQGPAPVQNTGGPDVTGALAGGGMGFDRSGSDAGVGGQPVTQVQSPYQGQGGFLRGGKPPMMSDFRPGQGLQVQGNPTAQPVAGFFMPRRPR